MNVELVLDARAEIGESPLWIPSEHALYWIDIKAPALYRYIPHTGGQMEWTLPTDVGAFALDGQGRALVALRTGLHWLDLATSDVSLVAQSPFDPRLIRFNEGACDSLGRFWVGTMADPPNGVETDIKGLLFSFTGSGGLIPHPASAFIFNGMAWNADETFFYLAHSEDRAVYRYPYNLQNGVLGEKSMFIHLADPRGVPDGAAMDTEGGYWCAVHGAGCLHRYTPHGQLDEIVQLPVSQPTMCCFVGEALSDLYITSSREKLSATQLQHEPYAGGIFRLRPKTAGLPKNWKFR
jgi:sugar lactone lactonase YvrE